MPQPFFITENIEFSDDRELQEGRVEAYDRDQLNLKRYTE